MCRGRQKNHHAAVYYSKDKKTNRTRWVPAMMTAVLLFIGVFCFGSITADADDDLRINERKFYTSYVVQSGDTLWDIANEYMTEEYDSTQEYILEVISSNQMDSAQIYPGQLIILPYYADEPLY